MPAGPQQRVDVAVEEVELHQRRRAEARHQHRHGVARAEGQVGDDPVDHQPRHLGGAGGRQHGDAGLAVVADADLHAAVGDREVRLAGGRDRAGRQADADRAGVVERVPGRGHDLVERPALGGPRSRRPSTSGSRRRRRAGSPARPGRPRRRRRRPPRSDRDPVLGGELDRHLHVHVVAGVVAVEAGDAVAPVRGA